MFVGLVVRARFYERISWGNMATSNLLKVGSTSIQLFVLSVRGIACHVCSVLWAFSSGVNEQYAAPVYGRPVGVYFSVEQLSCIWLTLATYQWFSWLHRKATTLLNVKGNVRHGGAAESQGCILSWACVKIWPQSVCVRAGCRSHILYLSVAQESAAKLKAAWSCSVCSGGSCNPPLLLFR